MWQDVMTPEPNVILESDGLIIGFLFFLRNDTSFGDKKTTSAGDVRESMRHTLLQNFSGKKEPPSRLFPWRVVVFVWIRFLRCEKVQPFLSML